MLLMMALMPSSCGIFVYNDVTSAVTKNVSFVIFGVSMSICKRCLVSLR